MKRLIPAFICTLLLTVSVSAATPQQMEQARAAVYRLCLRYMNNGSGYLDDTKFPSTTSELEGSIARHDKEQANLKTLKSIPIPPESEYASWDKGTFDKFWTVTFYDKIPSFDGRSECRGRVAKQVSAIQVTVVEPAKAAEEPKPEEKPEETPEENPAPEAGTNADEIVAAAPANPSASDSELISATEGPVNSETQSKDSGNTVSIIVLSVLVLVVVGLVVYALNVMRKNKEESEQVRPRRRRRYQEEEEEDEPSTVSDADPEDESAFASYAAPTAAPDSRDAEIATLRAELDRLRRQTGKGEQQRYTPGTSRQRQPRVIYLARANSEGVFTRADAAYNMGNSIFKLVTTDGVSGTYQVIEDPAVFELALMTPTDYLENACTGRNLQLSHGASIIINEAAGTAIFDRGRWRVTRKAQIRYSR